MFWLWTIYGNIRLLKSFYILFISLKTYHIHYIYIYIDMCVCVCKFDVGIIYGFDIEIINYYIIYINYKYFLKI
jgi:hypothetical protein